MSLNELHEFVLKNQRKVAIASVLTTLFIIVLGIILQRIFLVPEEAKLPPFELSADTGSILGEVNLSKLPAIEVAGSIATYEVADLSRSLTEAEVVALASRFGFSGSPRREQVEGTDATIFAFTSESSVLMVTTEPRSLVFSSSTAAVKSGAIYDGVTGAQKAKEFLSAKNLPADDLSLEKARYLTSVGEGSQVTDDPGQANFLDLSLVWTAGGRSVFGEGVTEGAARVIFDRAGEIIYLKFNYPDSLYTLSKTVKLVSPTAAASDLPAGGLVVFTQPLAGEGGEMEISDLFSFTPESVRLVFVRPVGSSFLYPVYLFEGKGTTINGAVEAAVFYLAVSPDYIKR